VQYLYFAMVFSVPVLKSPAAESCRSVSEREQMETVLFL
jgi:hypothetical protein